MTARHNGNDLYCEGFPKGNYVDLEGNQQACVQ